MCQCLPPTQTATAYYCIILKPPQNCTDSISFSHRSDVDKKQLEGSTGYVACIQYATAVEQAKWVRLVQFYRLASTEGCVNDMFCITFNDQRETFFPGQEINGSLNLNLTAEIQISSKMF
jgi:hypothetical protein